jgi:hypothetical protein
VRERAVAAVAVHRGVDCTESVCSTV